MTTENQVRTPITWDSNEELLEALRVTQTTLVAIYPKLKQVLERIAIALAKAEAV